MKINMLEIKQELQKNGFAVIPGLLAGNTSDTLKNHLIQAIQNLINRHRCTESNYFSTVNRWPLNQLIDSSVYRDLVDRLARKIFGLVDFKLQPFEVDILYKSPYANLPTPCHQDIAYVRHKPYLVSTWIALTDISQDDSPLQFLPQSHRGDILPAVDFWRPDFKDEMRQSKTWQTQAKTMLLLAGDALIFSAKIWHASLAHSSSTARYALVIRWGQESSTNIKIPPICPTEFGIVHAGEYTNKLLARGLKEIFEIESISLLESIHYWQEQLKNHVIPFIIDTEQVFLDLEKLRLLDEAYRSYGGGDGQGIIYVAVWKSFLEPLKMYLENKVIEQQLKN